MAAKPVSAPFRPVSSSVPHNWTEELATQFWGEDDATTVFANPVDPDLLLPIPAREPARKPRPRGRPREARPRRPGPRSPGFAGVWLPAEAIAEAPPRRHALGHRLAVGLVIFGAGIVAGWLVVASPVSPMRLAREGTALPAPAATSSAPEPPAAAEPAVFNGRSAEPDVAAAPGSTKPAAVKVASPSGKAHRARRVHRERVAEKSVVKLDALDLTVPDPPGP